MGWIDQTPQGAGSSYPINKHGDKRRQDRIATGQGTCEVARTLKCGSGKQKKSLLMQPLEKKLSRYFMELDLSTEEFCKEQQNGACKMRAHTCGRLRVLQSMRRLPSLPSEQRKNRHTMHSNGRVHTLYFPGFWVRRASMRRRTYSQI